MPKQRAPKPKTVTDQELAKIIRKAQEQPGIADFMALLEQTDEVATLVREHREASTATTVVSATDTAA